MRPFSLIMICVLIYSCLGKHGDNRTDESFLTEDSLKGKLTDTQGANSGDCITKGGRAGDMGLKSWCWSELQVPEWDGNENEFYLYKDQIKVSNGDRWYVKQLTIDSGKLKFNLNPITPPIGTNVDGGYNYRVEITTVPWDIKHPLGTEEWFGWNYTFEKGYVIDKVNKWVFFQVHNGVIGESPQISLTISDSTSSHAGYVAGKVMVINNGNNQDYQDTGVLPIAGQSLKIVVHVIWGTEVDGLLQVWIDDVPVYDKQVSTVYPQYPWGGNAKWGIYHPRWRNKEDVQKSLDQGITHVPTSIGSLRILTRYPDHPDYGKDAYDLVQPRI